MVALIMLVLRLSVVVCDVMYCG